MSFSNQCGNGYLENAQLNDEECISKSPINSLNDLNETCENIENEISKDNLVNEGLKPKILIMGLPKSGKSSIQKVVFHKMSPNETFFLESSNIIIKDDIQASSFVFFSIYTLPGDLETYYSNYDIDELIRSCDALVFVIDAQDDYSEALTMLNLSIIRAYKLNTNIKFEIFIHKVDCLSDDNKIEVQRDVRQRIIDELTEFDNILLSYHLTSIYDHSIFEAFSKVVQKLIPQLPILENLLDIFITNSGIDKAFLFDVVSKIYIATDSSPVDMQSYELCCDMIDVVIDISGIYGVKNGNDFATFDGCSSSIIKLNNNTVLYLREVNKFLALVCILREENFDKQGLIDYNFQCFKEAVHEVFETKTKDNLNKKLLHIQEKSILVEEENELNK